jgi:hypothetical protein
MADIKRHNRLGAVSPHYQTAPPYFIWETIEKGADNRQQNSIPIEA